jgi:hypothetical protein
MQVSTLTMSVRSLPFQMCRSEAKRKRIEESRPMMRRLAKKMKCAEDAAYAFVSGRKEAAKADPECFAKHDPFEETGFYVDEYLGGREATEKADEGFLLGLVEAWEKHPEENPYRAASEAAARGGDEPLE